MSETRIVPIMGRTNCGGRCRLLIEEKDGEILSIKGDPKYPDKLPCIKGILYDKTFLCEERLTKPLKRTGKRGEGKFEEISWEELDGKAVSESRSLSNNPFDMSDRYWREEIRPVYQKMKGSLKDTNYDGSPEFRDLEYFLKMCRALDLRCKLIVLPVNGKWFDYTGRTREKRQVIGDTVQSLADRYGVECAVLSRYDYEPYITADAVHPWNKGWVRINEEIYQFYME